MYVLSGTKYKNPAPINLCNENGLKVGEVESGTILVIVGSWMDFRFGEMVHLYDEQRGFGFSVSRRHLAIPDSCNIEGI